VWGLEQVRILDAAKRKDARARPEENLTHALAQVQAIRERRAGPGAMPTEGRGGS